MLQALTESGGKRLDRAQKDGLGYCREKHRLLDDFLEAIHELNVLHRQQVEAVIEGDVDFTRFDILLHEAQEKKDARKYAWILHVETHLCAEGLQIHGADTCRTRTDRG